MFISIVVFCIWNIEGLRTELYVSDFITHHYPDIHLSGNDKLTTLILTDPVPALFALETGCLVFFMVEWVLGLVVCPRKRDYLTSWTRRQLCSRLCNADEFLDGVLQVCLG